jgi:hypothetical protein
MLRGLTYRTCNNRSTFFHDVLQGLYSTTTCYPPDQSDEATSFPESRETSGAQIRRPDKEYHARE